MDGFLSRDPGPLAARRCGRLASPGVDRRWLEEGERILPVRSDPLTRRPMLVSPASPERDAEIERLRREGAIETVPYSTRVPVTHDRRVEARPIAAPVPRPPSLERVLRGAVDSDDGSEGRAPFGPIGGGESQSSTDAMPSCKCESVREHAECVHDPRSGRSFRFRALPFRRKGSSDVFTTTLAQDWYGVRRASVRDLAWMHDVAVRLLGPGRRPPE